MRSIYQIAGLSKQAYHQYEIKRARKLLERSELEIQINLVREAHPGCGLEKLYKTLRPTTMGRDKFIDTFQELGYGIKPRKNYRRTTIAAHLKFPNLITGLQVYCQDQLWQSDITYIYVADRYYYLTFIIDVYTKEIKGFAVSDHLRAEANKSALRMAFKNSEQVEGLIHHSDRGGQYVDAGYCQMLRERGIHISMGLQAQDNAYAERVNGTIKNEYLRYRDIANFEALKRRVRKDVKHYNEKRIHNHLPDGNTPSSFRKALLTSLRQDWPTVIVYAEGNCRIRKRSNLPDSIPRTGPLVHVCPIENNM